MGNRQLEFGFENRPQAEKARRRRRRSGRAQWWFAQMRFAVNEAHDWPPASPTPEFTPPEEETNAHPRGSQPWEFSRSH
jgi:hypothetical protein